MNCANVVRILTCALENCSCIEIRHRTLKLRSLHCEAEGSFSYSLFDVCGSGQLASSVCSNQAYTTLELELFAKMPSLPRAKVPRRVVEVKLATVFYGGVSLAVYMYGQTMEIFNLLKAASLFQASTAKQNPVEPAPEELQGTVGVYYRLMHKILDVYGIELLVSIDILSGTSAGGINAISLAKAIACGADLSSVRSVWLKEADWSRLVFSPEAQRYNKPTRACLPPLGRYIEKKLLLHLLHSMVPSLSDPKVMAELPSGIVNYAVEQFLSGSSLFDSQNFNEVLNDAILKLSLAGASEKASKRLNVSSGGKEDLTLFVTATEVNSSPRRVNVPLDIDRGGSGNYQDDAIQEAGYGRVFEFNDLDDDFNEEYDRDSEVELKPKDALLGLAARATSAFPIAFRPTALAYHVYYGHLEEKTGLTEVEMDLALFTKRVKAREKGLKDILSRRADRNGVATLYQQILFPEEDVASGSDEYKLDVKRLMDGGLVNNKPFEPVISALKQKRLSKGNEVDRRLLFLDPHPDPKTSRKRDEAHATGYLYNSADERQEMAYVERLRKRKQAKEAEVTKSGEEEMKERLAEIKSIASYSYKDSLLSVYNAISSEPIISSIQEIDALAAERRHMAHTELRFVDSMAQQLNHNCESTIPKQEPPTIADGSLWDWSNGRASVLLGDYESVYTPFPRELEIYSVERKIDAVSSLLQHLSRRSCLNVSKDDERYFHLKKFVELFHKVDADYHEEMSLEDIVNKNPLWVEDVFILGTRNCSDTALGIFSTEAEIEKDRLKAVELLCQKTSILRRYMRNKAANTNGLDAFFDLVATEQDSSRSEQETMTDKDFKRFAVALKSLISATNDKATELLKEVEIEGRQLNKEIWKVLQVTLRGYWRYDLKAFGHTLEGTRSCNPITVMPLSPENSTHILPALRHSIREDGLISFADVFLFSSDFMHFGGFFAKENRQNDLLWGHLDGAEAMCKLLVDVARSQLIREKEDRALLSKATLDRGDSEQVGNVLQLDRVIEEAIVELLSVDFLKEILDTDSDAMEYFKAIGEQKRAALSQLNGPTAPTTN